MVSPPLFDVKQTRTGEGRSLQKPTRTPRNESNSWWPLSLRPRRSRSARRNSPNGRLDGHTQTEQCAVVPGQRVELDSDRQPLTQSHRNAERGNTQSWCHKHVLRDGAAFLD